MANMWMKLVKKQAKSATIDTVYILALLQKWAIWQILFFCRKFGIALWRWYYPSFSCFWNVGLDKQGNHSWECHNIMFTFCKPIKQVLWEQFWFVFFNFSPPLVEQWLFWQLLWGLGSCVLGQLRCWITLEFGLFEVWSLGSAANGCLTSWEVWWEEEDSLLTDNESYANQLAGTPHANIAFQEMRSLHRRHQRAFKVDPWGQK